MRNLSFAKIVIFLLQLFYKGVNMLLSFQKGLNKIEYLPYL